MVTGRSWSWRIVRDRNPDRHQDLSGSQEDITLDLRSDVCHSHFSSVSLFLRQTHSKGTPEQLSNAYDQFQAWASNPNLSRKFASTCVITRHRLIVERTFFGSEEEMLELEAAEHLGNLLDVTGCKVRTKVAVFSSLVGAMQHWLLDKALTLGGGIVGPCIFSV